MGNIFVTSDLHFGHNKEFVYGYRGYRTIEEHNEGIVSNWNSVVTNDDDVYLLGDVMLGDAKECAALCERLNGMIHIIRGNHDTDEKLKLYATFSNVVEIADAKYLRYEGGPVFYLSHYPTLVAHESLKKYKHAIINLYGHTHQKDNFYVLNGERHPYMYHVGLDSHDCTPVLLEDIIEETRNEKLSYDGRVQEKNDPFIVWNKSAERLRNLGASVYESHGHFNLDSFDGIRDELMSLMHEAGIERCIIPAIEYDSMSKIKAIFDTPEYEWVKYAFGSHPKYIWKEQWGSSRWDSFRRLLKDSKCVAVGETGLDYSYGKLNEEHRKMQMKMFSAFIDAANEAKLPMILHVRTVDPNKLVAADNEPMAQIYCPDANADALQVIKSNPIKYGAVLHCFYGDVCTMKAYMDAGVNYFGIGGRICQEGYPQMLEAVKEMPIDSILIETDSPFIKVNNEQLPNTSLSLLDIAERIAQIKEMTVEEVFRITYANAQRFFEKN